MEIIPREFDIEFIERTQKLIDNYNGETEFTLLINCLLGLIILPSEYNKRRSLNYLKTDLSQIPIIKNCLNESQPFVFNPTHKNQRTRNFVNSRKTLGCLLRKIRNGIAHVANVTPINEDKKWVGIRIVDRNAANNNNIELDVELKYNQVKKIAEHISTEYQKEILGV